MTCQFGFLLCYLRLMLGGSLLGIALLSEVSDVGVWVVGSVGVLTLMDTLGDES